MKRGEYEPHARAMSFLLIDMLSDKWSYYVVRHTFKLTSNQRGPLQMFHTLFSSERL